MNNLNFKLPKNKNRAGTFADQVINYVRERYHGEAPYVYTAAWVDRRTWSAIVTNPHRSIAKRTALQFAIALQLTRDETDVLLAAAGYALSPVIAEDAVFAYAIQERLCDLFKINQLLYDNGLKIIPAK